MTRRVPARRTHLFAAEQGMTNWRGDNLCACGQPSRHRIHVLPATEPAVAEQEARRLGEKDNDERNPE